MSDVLKGSNASAEDMGYFFEDWEEAPRVMLPEDYDEQYPVNLIAQANEELF